MLREILPAGIVTACYMLKCDSGELADYQGVQVGTAGGTPTAGGPEGSEYSHVAIKYQFRRGICYRNTGKISSTARVC